MASRDARMMRAVWTLALATFGVLVASAGCNDVFGIVELPATDAGTPAPTSTTEDGSVAGPKTGLLGLTTSLGPIAPTFDQDTYLFTTTPSVGVLGDRTFTVTPTASLGTDIKVAGTTVLSGLPSQQITRDLLGANVLDISVAPPKDFVRHYTLLMPAMQGAYVKASNTAQGAQFGTSVALSKDGSTLAVGAISDASFAQGINGNQSDTTSPGSGAVFIFVREALAWKQQAYIKPSNTRKNAQFGSVALSDNGDTLIVGSTGESSATKGTNGNQSDTSAQGAGAVYVFARSGTTWSQDAYVKPSNTRTNAVFGAVVTISGDGTSFAVGSTGESSATSGVNGNQNDTSATTAGAVYVFGRSGGTWVQQTYLKASNTRANAYFGSSLAMSQDGSTLAVGAYNESSGSSGINGNQNDQSAISAGAVYVFTRNGSSWAQQAYVKAGVARANAYFGYTVALSTNGSVMAVGAYGETSGAKGVNGNQMDTSQPYSGAAYVFSRSGNTWNQEAFVKASNSRAYLYFANVGLSGDGTVLAVAAVDESSASGGLNGNQDDQTFPNSGAVYVFTKKNGAWGQQAYAKASNAQPDGRFGSALAISADGTMMAVGSSGERCKSTGINGDQSDYSLTNAGAVYLFP